MYTGFSNGRDVLQMNKSLKETRHYGRPEDAALAAMLDSVHLCASDRVVLPADVVMVSCVQQPDERFGFLHETAITEYKGVLYASWYCCPEKELQGHTPICGRRSRDGGKSWTDVEIIADAAQEGILYCPPVYGECDGKLYMLMNRMVAPDHIHALDLFILNEETDLFEQLWSRPLPFKLNTNVITLPDGRLLLPGRVAELDGFPNTPAVMISDSGKIDAPWRIVRIAPDGALADGAKLIHPEMTVICHDGMLYAFGRNDERDVPYVYISRDLGETWSGMLAHDIPYTASKIYAGTLRDGRHYLIANTDKPGRRKLSLFLSEAGRLLFGREIVLFDEAHAALPGVNACHYPAAVEADGRLYIIATMNYDWSRRGAALFTVKTGEEST